MTAHIGLHDHFIQDYTGIYESALNLRAKRSAVIAGNLANADTPNYKAQDFDFKQALAQHTEQPTQGIYA